MEGVKKIYNNITKSPRDDRMYRGVELCNNMKVLVISDPSTDKSAAALDVHIGKISMKKYDKLEFNLKTWLRQLHERHRSGAVVYKKCQVGTHQKPKKLDLISIKAENCHQWLDWS